MSFTILYFFVFVAASLAAYFFCASKKYQWCVLLASSYAFYAFAGWDLLAYILFTTGTVFRCALWLDKANSLTDGDKQNQTLPWYLKISKNRIIILVVAGNLGIFAFLKLIAAPYYFLVPEYSLLLPLGISFYTFQAIGYLIDVYRGKLKPERNFARFALFLSFFPQLIQGPVSRHSELAGQLYASRKFDHAEARRGFQLIIWGLFKKLVVADRLAVITDIIFSQTEKYFGLYILIGAIAFTIRLYADFSGTLDAARGVAQMFGIKLPADFQRPFFATSLSGYWRRWHITINNWWRDYLFRPLVGFTRGRISAGLYVIGICVCICVVRVANGMWYGFGTNYIAFGLYHGALITISMAYAPIISKVTRILRVNTDCFSWKLFQRARTFLLVCLGWVFVAAESATRGFAELASIVNDLNPWILNYDEIFLVGRAGRDAVGWTSHDARIMIFSVSLLLVVDIMQEKGISIRETLERQNMVFRWLVLLGGIFAVFSLSRHGIIAV